jgi:hypothetical protein
MIETPFNEIIKEYKDSSKERRELSLQFYRGIYHELDSISQFAENNGLTKSRLYKEICNRWEEIKTILKGFYEVDNEEAN